MSVGRSERRAARAVFTVVRMEKDAQPQRRLNQIVHSQRTDNKLVRHTHRRDWLWLLGLVFRSSGGRFSRCRTGVPRGKNEKGRSVATDHTIKLTSNLIKDRVIIIAAMSMASVELVKWPR